MRTSDASGNIRLGYRLAAYTAVLFAVVGFMVLSAAPAAAQSNKVGELLTAVLQQAINWGRWAVVLIVIWQIIKKWKGTTVSGGQGGGSAASTGFPFKEVGKILLAGVIILYLMSWQGLTTLTQIGSGAEDDLAGIEKAPTVADAKDVFTKHHTVATTKK